MDVRRSENRLVRSASAALRRFNGRHPWDHNDHFHRWILRRLPVARRRALDAGCGAGTLAARLSGAFDEVLAVDIDPTMVHACRRRTRHLPRVTVRQTPFEEVSGSFDLLTMVASLHHMPPGPALRHARDLLAPGGRLLVVGLARVGSPVDAAYDLVSAVLNPIVGLLKQPRPTRTPPEPDPMPVRDPEHTVDEVAASARRVLPGARVRRRLFFRYTLEWGKPISSPSA